LSVIELVIRNSSHYDVDQRGWLKALEKEKKSLVFVF